MNERFLYIKSFSAEKKWIWPVGRMESKDRVPGRKKKKNRWSLHWKLSLVFDYDGNRRGATYNDLGKLKTMWDGISRSTRWSLLHRTPRFTGDQGHAAELSECKSRDSGPQSSQLLFPLYLRLHDLEQVILLLIPQFPQLQNRYDRALLRIKWATIKRSWIISKFLSLK